MNKTADTILEELPCIACDGSGAYQTNHDGDIEQCQYCYQFRFPFKEKAKQALMNDILALVGPDSEQGDPVKNSIVPMQFTEVVLINEFKHKLRQKIRHYFGQDNQGGKT